MKLDKTARELILALRDKGLVNHEISVRTNVPVYTINYLLANSTGTSEAKYRALYNLYIDVYAL